MIGRYKRQIFINNADALEVINEIIPTIKRSGFIYLDPPYFKKGQDLYENFYNVHDHKALSIIIQEKISHPWIVSYDNDATVREYYCKMKQIIYGIPYSAGAHYRGSEMMCFSPRLEVPDVVDPLRVKWTTAKIYN